MDILTRTILWGSRLVCIAILLWWPRVWYDPIYTPRQARLAGQELHLPNGAIPTTQDEQAMAIFWEWQQRTLVTTQWGVESFRGIREPQGRWQAILALLLVLATSRSVVFLLERKRSAPSSEKPERKSEQRGMAKTLPLWNIFRLRVLLVSGLRRCFQPPNADKG